MAENRANLKTVISADSTQFNSELSRSILRAQRAGMGIAKGVGRATVGIAKMGATAAVAAGSIGLIGGALAGAAMLKGLKSAADLGGKVSDLAAQTGIAAGNITVMQRALEDNGVAGDKVGSIINKLQRSIYEAQEGTGAASKAFGELGLNISDLMRMTPDKQFESIQRAISQIEDPTKRAAMAMQIFGKSGGSLLTLFADTGAFDNAAKFVGTQADILNRSATVFDSISDKLARVPDKLQGFFVGFLEPFAKDIDGILQKFDDYDFAALGLRVANGFNLPTISKGFVAMGALLSAVVGEGIAKGVQIGGAIIAAAFSPEGLSFIGDQFVNVFKNAFLEIGLLAVKAGVAVAQAMKGQIGFADIPEAILGKDDSKKAGRTMADVIQDAIDGVDFAPSDNIQDAARKFRRTMGDLFPLGESGPSPSPQKEDDSGLYDLFKSKPKGPTFEQMGPSKALANKGIFDAIAKRDASSKAGFGGLAGLYGMQVDRVGGGKLGANSAFNRDRERLGVGSGLVTGGLGEKRRLNTKQEKEKEPKEELGFLQSIDRNIKSALTVG
jgi:hypothetical protein